MGDNSSNLKKMIRIYKPNGLDWMNFALSRRNPYTFHHIVSRSNGGGDDIQNGAILTRKAHDLLHILEYVCPLAYLDLEELFIEINISKKTPDGDIIKKIDNILHSVFFENVYKFIIDTDLSEYSDIYYEKRKTRIKRLRK